MKHNKGFTIIELMIAVAIIGVISSIGIPAFKNYLKRSKASEVAQITAPYKLSITECSMNNDISQCDEQNGNVQVGTDGRYGNVHTKNGQVIYTFSINDISFKDHNVIFYVDNFDPYSTIKWSCKTSAGFDTDLLPKNLTCKSVEQEVTVKPFNNINEVKDYFGGNPVINGNETNPNWFTGGTSSVSYLSEATMKSKCEAGLYLCTAPYGNTEFELTKADGTKITNLDQFCKDGAKGYIVNAVNGSNVNPFNAGLVCVK